MISLTNAKRLKFFLLSLALGSVGAGCQTTFKGLGVSQPYHLQTLSNGLRVLIVERPDAPVVTYQTWVLSGSAADPAGESGLAHLFEHLLYKGTVRYPAGSFFALLESRGAEVNAFTTRDATVFYQTFTPDLLDAVIALESDRLAHFTPTDEMFEIERQVVLQERKSRVESSPAGRMEEALWQLALPNHPYGVPTIGTPEDLKGLRASHALHFFQSHYRPSQTVIVVVGPVHADRLVKRLRDAYENIAELPRPERRQGRAPHSSPNAKRAPRRVVLEDEVPSTRVMVGYPIVAARHPDAAALDVLATLCFEGRSAALTHQWVEEQKLVLSVDGVAYTPREPGLFWISAVLRKDVSADAYLNAVRTQWRKFLATPFSPSDLDRAVRQLKMQILDSIRTTQGLAQFLGTAFTVYTDPRDFSKDLERYSSVTPADLQRVVKTYLVDAQESVVVLNPQKKGSKK